MYTEELFEEGTVIESGNGFAVINILDKEKCEECSAKVYCKPSSSEGRQLKVKDPLGAKPGDNVKVSIEGRKILSASFIIYGFPLILILAGIYFGFMLFESNRELFSTTLSILLIGFYAGIIFVIQKYKTVSLNTYPEIIFIKRGEHYENNISNDR
ncbi:MAG: SoxR reducing system RseC family protein [Ignavibacteriales bacterium]|nr:MAG: SoxR reducing system RseC family protein [Ignavibacteriales bacterium]